MSFNPIDWKRDITSMPLKLLWEHVNPEDTIEGEASELGVLALYGMIASATIAVNLSVPSKLIGMGIQGDRYFSHLSYAKNVLGYPMPRFNYITPASQATKLGARLGGKVGAAKLGGKLAGRFVPGVGWALLAYDVYDIAANRSLWGFDLS